MNDDKVKSGYKCPECDNELEVHVMGSLSCNKCGYMETEPDLKKLKTIKKDIITEFRKQFYQDTTGEEIASYLVCKNGAELNGEQFHTIATMDNLEEFLKDWNTRQSPKGLTEDEIVKVLNDIYDGCPTRCNKPTSIVIEIIAQVIAKAYSNKMEGK